MLLSRLIIVDVLGLRPKLKRFNFSTLLEMTYSKIWQNVTYKMRTKGVTAQEGHLPTLEP